MTGWQFLDKGQYATYGTGYGTIIDHPVFAFLLEGGGQKILVDTGMGDTEHSLKYHHEGRQNKGQAIHEQLAGIGIGVEEIDTVIFTHLHWDHCFNMKSFTRARLMVSETEYRFALDPIPFYWSSYEARAIGMTPPFDGCTFDFTHGDEEVADGVTVFPTPGHSPGHVAVQVQTVQGTYVLIGDLALLKENFQPHRQKGWPFTPPGRFANIVDVWHSLEEVTRRADHILLAHDPSQFGRETYP